MTHRHTVSAAILLAALALGTTGCGGDDDPGNDPGALPAHSTSAPTSAASEPEESTSSNPEPWRAEFTKEQLIAFDRALAAWKQYGKLMEGYRRDPVNRETVQTVFERYTHNAMALADSYELSYINGGVRQLSPPTALSWTGRRISINPAGSLVEFDQCTDYTTLDIRRDRKPIEGAAPTKNDTAILRIRMDSDSEGNWRVFTLKVVDKPCV